MRGRQSIRIIVLAVALALPACGGTPPSPPATGGQVPARFEAGPCAPTPRPVPLLAGARCGQLIVPLNRETFDGRTLRLSVAVVPSRTQPPAKEPIVFLTGGPGQDAVADPPVPADVGINRDRDLIVMGQRGDITSSANLTCPEMDRFIARRIGMRYDAPATGEAYVQAVRECRDRLARGTDLTAMNSTESTADLIDLRKALGIGKWSVFSHSYGTDLALIYLRSDAAAISAVAFDGVTPPSVAALGWTWASARQALDAMVRACVDQPGCAKRYPDLEATFVRLVGEVEANPVATTVGGTDVVIDGGSMLAWFVPVATHLPADFPSVIDELAHGNPQPMAEQMAGAFAAPAPVGVFAWGLTLSIWCREWVPFESREDQLAMANKAFPSFPDSVKAQAPQLPFLREACDAWNVPRGPASIRDITVSNLPALVLSGSYDAQTGAVWGDYIAKNLSRSTVAVAPGEGHGSWAEPCGSTIIASFFADPNTVDVACTKDPPPPYAIHPPRP
ncbi:alpha/beta hydrolase [Nocardia sp. NPDC005746]|uniref:alpha/beta hydrolase n=1 Tax=Nocardia sp. NPDC005746 TaxID=3157062 RepID=UPI0034026EA7